MLGYVFQFDILGKFVRQVFGPKFSPIELTPCALMKSVHTTTEEAALSFFFAGLCFVVNQRHFRFGAREN